MRRFSVNFSDNMRNHAQSEKKTTMTKIEERKTEKESSADKKSQELRDKKYLVGFVLDHSTTRINQQQQQQQQQQQ